MSEHISTKFDAELEAVRSRVSQMGGLVENQLARLGAAMFSGDTRELETVMRSDYKINALEVEIDELCTHIIAVRQPVASDLRMIMTVIKTITDLERIGDKAEKIARMTLDIGRQDGLQVSRFNELRAMMDKVLDMVRQALDAFARLDTTVAPVVAERDKEIDRDFDGITRLLITHMMENPRNISTALDILFVAKAIERIGDHATNITEYIVYMVRGKDVRHVTPEELNQVAGGAR